jgi:multiple sugar transport system permease protein
MQRAMLTRPVGLLFLLPALVFVAVFLIYPFFSIVAMSFTDYQLVGASALNTSYVGLDNYSSLFNFERWMRRGELGHSLWITIQFVVGSALIGQVCVGMGLAVILNRRKGLLREIVYTLAIAAWIMPEVVVPQGQTFASVTVEGGKPGNGSLFLKGYGSGEVTIPVTVTGR